MARALLRSSGPDEGDTVVEEARFLPPLEFLGPSEASGKAVTLPCFPLPLDHAALPGTQRTLRISEPRYLSMYNDMLAAGQQHFVVPRCERGAEGVRLAEAAVVFRLVNLEDAPARARFRYSCLHNVTDPVRITRVLNPAVFADGSSYLRVECEEIPDADAGLDLHVEEAALMEAMGQVVQLREVAGDPLRRFKLSHDAQGRPFIVDNHLLPTVTEEALSSTPLDGDGLWRLAALWQGYCERRAVSLWQARDRARAGPPGRAAELREAYAADAKALASSTTDLMQRLLQAGPRSSRLAALRSAAAAEASRLAAASAMRMAVGAEPFA